MTTTETKPPDINDHARAGGSLDDLLRSADLVQPSEDDINAEFAPLRDEEEGTAFIPPDLVKHLTDLGNARLLVERVGQNFRWCGAMPGGSDDAKGWMVWNGTKWISDETNRIVQEAMQVADVWRERADALEARIPPPNTDLVKSRAEQEAEDERKAQLAQVGAMRKHANRCESAAGIAAMIRLARSIPGVIMRQGDFDRDRWKFSTPDMTYDLARADAYPPRRADHITRSGGHGVDPEQPGCPTWLRFLRSITGGDDELAAFLQRAAGYCLTGSTQEQCVFIAYGTGQNGKSTFLTVLKDLLGDYFASARVETFLERDRSAIPNDLAALAGTRLVVVNEPEEGAPLAESVVKGATGGDPIRARFLNREFFEYVPDFKLWIVTNHKPVIRGTDRGIWRRIRLVPFTVTVPDEERDDRLGDKLRAEYGAIMRWVLEGYRAWREKGLAPPRAVVEATAEYRKEMDVLSDFLEDKCEVGAGLSVGNTALFAAYHEWARRNGHHPMSQRSFSLKLKERAGVKQAPGRTHGRVWEGIRLRAEPVSERWGVHPGEA